MLLYAAGLLLNNRAILRDVRLRADKLPGLGSNFGYHRASTAQAAIVKPSW